MRIRKFAALSLLFLTSFAASGVTLATSQLESMYDNAFRAFDSANYNEALKALDMIDARQPNLAESYNLRGVVYMRQEKYDDAEAAFRKALSIEPKFWNASFNLAEVPFLKKDWSEARNRFEALIAGENQGLEPETIQLIQYKILLTFVLQGKANMVDWILNKFELSKESPALYYSNAAIALQQGNEEEANEWLSAAEKHFSAPLNKLYSESFYELGWKQKPAGERRTALEIAPAAERQERLAADAKANFEKAERAFEQRKIDEAMKFLDLAEAGAPNDPKADNLRGEILMAQKKFDEAEVVLRKAYTANPEFREAQYNLAQIPFKRGEYAEARDRFEGLFRATPGDDKNQASQLIKFKIFLTLLLEGKDEEAQQLMDQFKFTGDTPALYYAQAAWQFKFANAEGGVDWVQSARKIYSPALNMIFADSFYDLGWLDKAEASGPPQAALLPRADASPAGTEAKPVMRLGQDASLRPPEPATQLAASPAPGKDTVEAATKASSASPVVATLSATPHHSSKGRAVTPAATALASPPTNPSSPSSAEMLDRIMQPRALVVGTLLLAGALLLVWLIIQQIRRRASRIMLYNPSPSWPEESGSNGLPGAEEKFVATGPPHLSLDLKASEAAVRGMFPSKTGMEHEIPPDVHASLATTAVAVAELVVEPPTKKKSAQKPADEKSDAAVAPVSSVSTNFAKGETVPESAKGSPPAAESGWMQPAPVGQGQPIPQLTSALSAEPVIPELAQSEPDSPLELIESEPDVAAPIAGRRPAQSSIETPSFASKIICTEPIKPQPISMTEATSTPTFAPAQPAPSPAVSLQPRAGNGHTEVQLTFSLEITSMQITPTFKLNDLHLKPTSKVVSMRLASPQDPMNLQATFELAKIELSGESFGNVHLAPTTQQRPDVLNSSSIAISGLEFVAGEGAAPLQLTPSHQEQASVQLTAEFQIAAIEFTPLFEISTIVLNATSKKVSMQLPGSGPSSIASAPVFEIENVQLGSGNDLSMIQVSPGRAA